MPWSSLFSRKKQSVIIIAQQNANLINFIEGGGALRDIILADPRLLAYYEYEGIVMDGVIDFTVSPVDSGPNGYHWTAWDAQIPQFGGPPFQVGPYPGIVGESYLGNNEASAAFPLPAVDALPFTNDGTGISLEYWIQSASPAVNRNILIRTGIIALGEQSSISMFFTSAGPGVVDWQYDIQFNTDIPTGFSGTLLGSPTDADFHHVVVTALPGGSAILYYDGVARDVQPAPATLACTLTPITGLGWQMNDSVRIDETAFYGGILTPSEVLNRYQAGIGA